jgi:predicted chitinase
LPASAAHWRQIPTARGNVWVHLNARGTFKFCDADFPAVAGWNCYDDDTRPGDQRCDSSHLKRRIRALLPSDADRSNPQTDRAALARGLGTDELRRSLHRTIHRFPSEWDRGTIATRYEWLRDPQLAFGLDDQENWERFVKHLEAVTFTDLPQGYKNAVWHVHPTQFISHMRQCGWLDKDELASLYPGQLYSKKFTQNPNVVRERYRICLNRAMEKYLINTPARRAHFLGQGAVESNFLSVMVEASVNPELNPNHASLKSEATGYYAGPDKYLMYLEGKLGNVDVGDGIKFRGRGMKQLTGRENYSKYWVYRGWLSASSFQSPWWNPSRPEKAPQINDPQKISTEPYNTIDSGGWYWMGGSAANKFQSINAAIINENVSPQAVFKIAKAINGINPSTHAPNALQQREKQTDRMVKIIMDN